MSDEKNKGRLRWIVEYVGHAHLISWLVELARAAFTSWNFYVSLAIAIGTAYWAKIIQWGYLPVFLVGFGIFVAAIWGLNGIVWLRRRPKPATPSSSMSLSPTAIQPSPASMREEIKFAEENDDLYSQMKALYEDRYNGKADFYHYSGTRVHNFVSMLFKRGYSIRLFLENPDTAHRLGCDFQQQRIDSMIAQFMNELAAPASGTKGRIEVYQSAVPMTVRAALLDDQHIVLGWYVYEMLRTPTKGFPKDKIAVWGHEGWGLIIHNQHPHFKFAREFLQKYEQRIGATKVWSYPDDAQKRC